MGMYHAELIAVAFGDERLGVSGLVRGDFNVTIGDCNRGLDCGDCNATDDRRPSVVETTPPGASWTDAIDAERMIVGGGDSCRFTSR